MKLNSSLMAAASSDNPPPASAGGDGEKKGKLVKVRVRINSLGEGDGTYAKGEEFETTAERAKALGDSVEIVK